MTPEYSISPARYAKGMMIVHCPSTDGYKTRAAYLACALKARYTNRCNGYVMSPAKARKFEVLYADGWDATCLGTLIPPDPGSIASQVKNTLASYQDISKDHFKFINDKMSRLGATD